MISIEKYVKETEYARQEKHARNATKRDASFKDTVHSFRACNDCYKTNIQNNSIQIRGHQNLIQKVHAWIVTTEIFKTGVKRTLYFYYNFILKACIYKFFYV